MTALRLARGFTGRSKIVKFEGCYHGHGDSLLVKAGSGALTFGQPSSAGVPPAIANETIVLPYNDLAAVEAAFRSDGARDRRVIVEPVAGNMNLIAPAPGFLEGLRDAVRPPRRRADLRRSDDGLSRARARRAGALRHHARPDDARQGDRRRHAGRARSAAAARSWRRSRRSVPSIRRERCRAIRSPSPRGSRRSLLTEAPGFYDASARARARSSTV